MLTFQEKEPLMILNKEWKPLKLIAIDDKDLLIFTQCIYEAIFLPTEINFNKKKKNICYGDRKVYLGSSRGKRL